MSKLVCSQTLWSCGLACIEAILSDNGIEKKQSEMIAAFGYLFPSWQAQPGLMNPPDFETVFKEVGFPVKVSTPPDFRSAIAQMAENDTVGGVIITTKFWNDPVGKNNLCDLIHAVRLLSANANGIEVMNPYRCPAVAKDEFYTWQEVALFKGGALIFKK